jgi:hypothetical protein
VDVITRPRIGGPLVGSTSGSIPFANSSSQFAQDNSNLFWDATNSRAGFGTTSPAGRVHSKTEATNKAAAIFEARQSQTANVVELRDYQANVQGGFREDFSLLIQGNSTTSINGTNYYTGYAKGDANVYGNYAFVVDRNYFQNNLGTGAAFFLKDSSSYAGLRLWTNTAAQNACDFEVVTQNGVMMVFPYTGGIKVYNTFQNTPDISIMKVPTQTLYPGGGISSPQGTFRFNVVTISATSANSLDECAALLFDGAPVVGVNMTIPKRYAGLFLAGDAGGIAAGFRAASGQTANVSEWMIESSNTVKMSVDSACRLNLHEQNEIRFQDSAGGQYAAIKAPATIGSSHTYTLPTAVGSSGQYLKASDGSGTLTWDTPGVGSTVSIGRHFMLMGA